MRLIRQEKLLRQWLEPGCVGLARSISGWSKGDRGAEGISSGVTKKFFSGGKSKVFNYEELMAPPGSTLHDALCKTACKKQTGVSLKAYIDTAQLAAPGRPSRDQMLVRVASFLHREMPIRLAHRVLELEGVPDLLHQKSIRLVREWYVQSYKDLVDAPFPNTKELEENFAAILQSVYTRHAPTLVMMSKGVWELREGYMGSIDSINQFYDFDLLHSYLDQFFISRIGIRMLIGNYLALRAESAEMAKDGWLGLVCKKTSAAAVCRTALEDAQYVCTRQYGSAPPVTLHGRLDLTFSYIPSHLHYIMLELLKNSMRATAEYRGLDKMQNYPIKIIIADSDKNEDVVIKVADEGGGLPRSYLSRGWSYLYTTADPVVQKGFIEAAQASDHARETPLAGLGYGLPISRTYARYFGGDIEMMSMEGYGTDVYTFLTKLGDNPEPLP